MAKINVYHRAFIDYRKETMKDKTCSADRKVFRKLDLNFDVLQSRKYKCTIDEEWIIKIEEGLVFVEKAVAEERQFIRVNGEVVPIEKAKKISKHSIEHLAKHSNMITHVPENPEDDLIPDAIYMVEKLNDYAVYENRFLYMLLCYLRDFIELRLKKIYRLRMTYICDFSLKKHFDSRKRNFTYDTVFHDERYDNPYPIQDDLSSSLLKRIEDCQQIILMLLKTDLMVEVSKAPMIKPPIVKTNVLKMNNNFVKSLALYDYIVSYKGEGYFSEEVVTDLVPLNDTTADELCELLNLTSYLTYKYGNDICDVLDTEYDKEQELKRQEEVAKMLQQIARLKNRVEETGTSLEEYILLLEKRNRMLENDALELVAARNEILQLNNVIDQLNIEKEELNRKIDDLYKEIEEKIREIAYLNQKYIDDMNALKAAHALEIENLNKQHEEEVYALHEKYRIDIENINIANEENINKINLEHQENVESINQNYQDQIKQINNDFNKMIELLNDEHKQEIDKINENHNEVLRTIEEKIAYEHQNEINEYQNSIEKLTFELNELNTKYNQETTSYADEVRDLNTRISDKENELTLKVNNYEEKLKELESSYKIKVKGLENKNKQYSLERELAIAELDAIRVLNGEKTPSAEFTSKERFKELEREFEAFNKFFKTQWAMTKKEIRKQLLWTKEDNKRKTIKAAKKQNSK